MRHIAEWNAFVKSHRDLNKVPIGELVTAANYFGLEIEISDCQFEKEVYFTENGVPVPLTPVHRHNN